MNITSIDVSAVPDVSLGETVVAISEDASAPNSTDAIARATGTIPYEIFVHIPAALPRIAR
jgi:alanine racemase